MSPNVLFLSVVILVLFVAVILASVGPPLSQSNTRIWGHWGYLIMPIFLILMSILWLISGHFPQHMINLGFEQAYAYRVANNPGQGFMMLIFGLSFWPMRYVLQKQSAK